MAHESLKASPSPTVAYLETVVFLREIIADRLRTDSLTVQPSGCLALPDLSAVAVSPPHDSSVSFAIPEPNTVSYSQSSLIHLVGPSDCTLHGFVHG
ncbi:hypothetical protein P7K49_015326, partial [Saguinus oedipus]